MSWRITKEDVEIFRRDLWKDERRFPPRNESNIFKKDCFSSFCAKKEWLVLEALAKSGSEQLGPEPISIHDSTIEMSAANGMRLFELLRVLNTLEVERRDGKALQAREILINRQRQRLARIQNILLEIAPALDSKFYPLQEKLSSLLGLLSRVLNIQIDTLTIKNITQFSSYWSTSCCQIPFRDATPKNTIVTHSNLDRLNRSEGGEGDLQCVSRILDKSEINFWEKVPLIDVDFTSVEHLTTLEDDPISLHFHECSFGSCPIEPTSLLLIPSHSKSDGFRTAATFLVRYMRFGGRKLAYKLINSQGFEIRFRFDDPFFYFQQLETILQKLSQDFLDEYSYLIDLVSKIGRTATAPNRADRELLRVDHFRSTYGYGGSYYPENPLELEEQK